MFWSNLWDLLVLALVSSYTAAGHWYVFTKYLLQPLCRLLLVLIQILIPHVQVWMIALYKYLLSCSPYTLAKVFGLAFIIVYSYFAGYWSSTTKFVRDQKLRVKQRYRQTKAKITSQSKIAGFFLPHLLYILGISSLYFTMPAYLQLEVADVAVPFFQLIWPVFKSVKTLLTPELSRASSEEKTVVRKTPKSAKKKPKRTRSQSTEASTRLIKITRWTKFWILWAVVNTIIGVLSFFVTSGMAYYLNVPTRALAVLLCWMHCPWTDGTSLMYQHLGPLIFTSDFSVKERANEQANVVFRTLKMLNVIPEKYLNMMSDCWKQGPALLGIMFLFTPGFITFRAGLVIGMLLPAYNASNSISTQDKRNLDWWLTYFSVLAILEYLVTGLLAAFSWLPLFYHVKLLALLWLQFPYFRGAQRLFELFGRKVKVD